MLDMRMHNAIATCSGKDLEDHLAVLRGFLRGAEGESGGAGQGSTSGDNPAGTPDPESDSSNGDDGQGGTGTSDGGTGEGAGEGSGSGTDTSTPESFSREYVEKLRRENADYRTKYQAAESKLTEQERAKMDAKDRAELERDEAKKSAEKLQNDLRMERIRNAVILEASDKNFHDTEDAVRLIDLTDIKVNDDGSADKRSVKAAVEALAKEKKHLVKGSNPGSGDGGSRGNGVSPADVAAKTSQELQGKGYVQVPSR